MKKIFELEKIISQEKDGKPVALSYISGNWQKGMGKQFEVVDTTTNKVLGYSNDCTLEQISEAFKAARPSQEYWRFEVGQQEKEKIFKKIAEKLEERRPEFALIMARRGVKVLLETDSDVREACDTIDHYIGELSRNRGDFEECQMKDKIALTINEPYKVVVGITPWNFPMAIPSWKTFGTLTAGGSIILKDSSQTPFTTSLLVETIHESISEVLGERSQKLKGIVQLLHGGGSTTGHDIITKGDYDLLSFTGGVETQQLIRKLMAEHNQMKPDHYELGGKNAMIVMNDFDVNLAVGEAINAAYGTSGQRCVSLSRVYVHEDIFKDFVQKFKQEVLKIKIGSPLETETKVGPVVTTDQLEKIHGFVKRAKAKGYKPLIGGYALNKKSVNRAKKEGYNFNEEDFRSDKCGNGNFYVPTVLINAPQESEIVQKEIFGPVVVINKFSKEKNNKETLDKAIKLMNDTYYGLSNSLLTNDMRLIFYALPKIESGIVYVGRGTTGAELNKYFGGVKGTGWGREGRSIESFTEKKQIYIDFHGKPRMAQTGAAEEVQKSCAEAWDKNKDYKNITEKGNLNEILKAFEKKASK